MKFDNVISGPLTVTLNQRSLLNWKGAFTETRPADPAVEVSKTVNEGRTGQEYPKNLLNPGNDYGNRWHAANEGEQ